MRTEKVKILYVASNQLLKRYMKPTGMLKIRGLKVPKVSKGLKQLSSQTLLGWRLNWAFLKTV